MDSAALDHVEKPRVLDICCGTGAVLFAFADRYPQGTCIGCDFSRGMLLAARRKGSAVGVTFIQANAAGLPFVR